MGARGIEHRKIPVKVVWMPVNFSHEYPAQSYWGPLQQKIQGILEEYNIPVLDLRSAYTNQDFHDFVHMERTIGAPKFTDDLSNWLEQSKPTENVHYK
ncbi:hypothetical protein ERY13_17775 [Paenibacillus mucilaginosus]|uniref:hypothetical protein n=1 Tax=Paenibacillus mucilaginosus TaxID=61624 RepID=UPI0005A09D72|nr:hypothetical protein [Paenibacillus mucilaginosus]WFA18988.1 hypothetical protein ERY13_17775 [Paenibacillus mucilaginosus]